MEKTERKSPKLGAKGAEGQSRCSMVRTPIAWSGAHVDERHLLQAGCKSKQSFTNFEAHVEFLLPFKPLARAGARQQRRLFAGSLRGFKCSIRLALRVRQRMWRHL